MTAHYPSFEASLAIQQHLYREELAEEAAEHGFDSVHEYLAALAEARAEAWAEQRRDDW